ncbi:MAG: helix-turn-helix domain-containing protein [Bacteroidetes bacterium]|jgi:DNA-binding XRE family transcriptional regulator|nr:helix-turn-helix domain-containing protein [Bacteroidota bacterium]
MQKSTYGPITLERLGIARYLITGPHLEVELRCATDEAELVAALLEHCHRLDEEDRRRIAERAESPDPAEPIGDDARAHGELTPREFARIRKLRLGMTQAQLAAALGVSTRQIQKLEADNADIRPVYALALRQLAASAA